VETLDVQPVPLSARNLGVCMLSIRGAFVLASIGVGFASSPALAAGWTQPDGGYYAKAWGRLLTGKKFMTAEGEKRELEDRFTDFALNVYGEYGLNDHITLVAFTNPVGYATYAGEGGTSQTYAGFFGAGVRAGKGFGDLRLAVEARYGYAPDVGAESVGAGAVDGDLFVMVPTVETHRFEGEVQAGLPLSFGWLAASAGIRAFSEDGLDPAIIGGVQLGWTIAPAWTVEGHLNLNHTLGDVVVTNALGAGQTSYIGFGASGTWWMVDNVGLNLGADLAGRIRSNAAVPSLALGIEVRGG
jgi:hypothetical protein